MNHTDLAWSLLSLLLISVAVYLWLEMVRDVRHRTITLDALCPACGHSGCKLRFVPSHTVEVGEKREIRLTEPMVERECLTCGAKAYEKPVVDPKEWIAK